MSLVVFGRRPRWRLPFVLLAWIPIAIDSGLSVLIEMIVGQLVPLLLLWRVSTRSAAFADQGEGDGVQCS